MVCVDVVRVVNLVFFDCGWSKVFGFVFGGIGWWVQMVCVVCGYVLVIFKVIWQGGCYMGVQLCFQFIYLIIKFSFIFDFCGIYDGKKVFLFVEIECVVWCFENQWNECYSLKFGYILYFLMVFLVGICILEVCEIICEICEWFFEGDGVQFDYIVVIYEDCVYFYVYIVLNCCSKDGEMFFFGKDYYFNYDVFCEVMVEVVECYGLCFEVMWRLDWGVFICVVSDVEICKVEQEGRVLVECLWIGVDFDYVIVEVVCNVVIYWGFVVEVLCLNFYDVVEVLFWVGDVFVWGNCIQLDGVLYMIDEVYDFD